MKVALITGTTRGIGLTLAGELLDRGWIVTGFARGTEPQALAANPAYHHLRVDLADLDELERKAALFARTHDLAGAARLALINNAGVLQPMRPLEGCALSELDRAYRINAVAPTWLMGFALAERQSGPLTLVNLSSGAATKPYPSWVAYCSTKAALKMAAEALAAEIEAQNEAQNEALAESGAAAAQRQLAIVTYAPHVVATAMQQEIRASAEEQFPLRQRFVELHESGGLVGPEGPAAEIAELCERDGLPLLSELRFKPA